MAVQVRIIDRVSSTRLKSTAKILPNNIAKHFVSVYCKKTKMKEGSLLNLCCYQIHPGILLHVATTWVAVLIYAEKEELVSGVLISIA